VKRDFGVADLKPFVFLWILNEEGNK